MTVASDRTLRSYHDFSHPYRSSIIRPFVEQTREFGMTYGLGPAGYDIRIAQSVCVPFTGFILASSFEHFSIPDNMVAIVYDKSTWARQGLAVQNTVAEPGWRGYLTLELTNHSKQDIYINSGMPIAQVIFHLLDYSTSIPYKGKYQDQMPGPQQARFE